VEGGNWRKHRRVLFEVYTGDRAVIIKHKVFIRRRANIVLMFDASYDSPNLIPLPPKNEC